MLCGNCEFVLARAIRSQKKDYSPFFESLEGFFESVAIGCLICRQLWHDLREKYQRNDDDQVDGGNLVELSIPNDFSTFQLQIQEMRSFADTRDEKYCRVESEHDLSNHNQIFDRFQYSVDQAANYWVDDYYETSESMSLLVRSRHFRTEHYFDLTAEDDNNLSELPWTHSFPAFGASTSAMYWLWRYWLQNCLETHSMCNPPAADAAFTPTRLIMISVEENTGTSTFWRVKVFHSTEAISYTTLSHCWGASEHIKLTGESLSTFSDKFHSIDLLPKTYRHALEITSVLGFQYIWIDSLCILQDDPDDWRKESSNMGAIYANASCNIAAESAEDGNQGCYRERDPTVLIPTIISTDTGENQMVRYSISGSVYQEHILGTPLTLRGWVVQERCLARRQLSFGKNQVFWECAELGACEIFPNGIPDYILYEPMLVCPAIPKPMLISHDELKLRQTWCSLVEHYSHCKLSNKSDKTIAFAGLASQYRSQTGDRYLAGLWERGFHKQLCWSSDSYWSIGKSTIWAITRQYHAPTWSWFSIDGPVTMSADVFGEHLCFLHLIDARIESSDPENLHSFVSCEIKIQAIVLPIVLLSDLSSPLETNNNTFRIRLREQYVDVKSYQSSFADEWPQRDKCWDRFRRTWESELFWVVSGGELTQETRLSGIIVRNAASPSSLDKYVRIGILYHECPELLDMLTTNLGLSSPSQLVNDIDLNDPRISELVRTIDII